MKKVTSIIITLVMLLSMLPANVFAQEKLVSITFTPADTYVLYENSIGDYQDDGEGGTFFEYDHPRFQVGDFFTLNYEDHSVNYTYTRNGWDFISESGERLETLGEIYTSSSQKGKHWTLGSDNTMRVVFEDKEGTRYEDEVSVTIIQSPYSKIKYTPNKEIKFIENDDGEFDTDENGEEYFYYYRPWFIDGDVITLTLKETGEEISYTYQWDDEANESVFISEDGDQINPDEIDLSDNQYRNHWTIGSDNFYTVTYAGVHCNIPVTIVENKVKSITYQTKDALSILENTDGEIEIDNDGEEYFYYWVPWFRTGSVLTVTYKDNTTVAYTYTVDPDTDAEYFVSENGDKINEDDVRIRSNQSEKHWTVGTDNYFTIEYSGASANVPIEITENNVYGISIELNTPMTIYETDYHLEWDEDDNEYKAYDIPRFTEGDCLTIYDKEGNSTQYTLEFDEEDGESYFTYGTEKIHPYALDIYSNQEKKHWTVGGENYFTVEYRGYKTTVPVTLIESDVKEISFTPKEEIHLKEHEGGEYRYTDLGERFYFYHNFRLQEGSVLTVAYEDDTTVSYVFNADSESFISEDGEELTWDEVIIDDKQYEQPWEADRDNYFNIMYHGVSTDVQIWIDKAEEESTVNEPSTAEDNPTTKEEITTQEEVTTKGEATTKEEITTQPEQTTKTTSEVIAKPKATSITKVKAKKKAMLVKWKKVTSQTNGYEIQYSTKKNFKKNAKIVVIPKNKTTKKTIKKLKAKKKYFVRIRTYRLVDQVKYYSDWSKSKTVKTKK